jgi:hypothetical protein
VGAKAWVCPGCVGWLRVPPARLVGSGAFALVPLKGESA